MLQRTALALVCCLASLVLWTTLSPGQEPKRATPVDGHEIHVVAPHVVEGVVMGPYHHYCKAVSPEVLECLIYESTDPKALLVQVEYMIAKSVTRPNVRLDLWNKHYHDHLLEIASGRVQVLDRSPEEAKAIADAAAQTDGIIFHLWWPQESNRRARTCGPKQIATSARACPLGQARIY